MVIAYYRPGLSCDYPGSLALIIVYYRPDYRSIARLELVEN